MLSDSNLSFPEYAVRIVGRFCLLQEADFDQLSADLSLSLPTEALLHCRNYFKNRERHDPTVGDLLLLNGIFAMHAALSQEAELPGIEFTDREAARYFADMIRMRNALSPDISVPPTMAELLGLSGRYLRRAGLYPAFDRLRCGIPAGIAARSGQNPPTIFLSLPECDAALINTCAAPPCGPLALLLLSSDRCDDHDPFPELVARFFKTFRGLPIQVLKVTGKEGLLPAVLSSGGAELDLLRLPDYVSESGFAPLFEAGKDALLLLAPVSVVPNLCRKGFPISFLGRLTGNGRLTVKCGVRTLSDLSLSFLTSFGRLCPAAFPVGGLTGADGDRSDSLSEIRMADQNGLLLAGVSCRQDSEKALLALIFRILSAGGNPSHLTFAAALSLPYEAAEASLFSKSLPLLLGCHRVLSELSIPTSETNAIYAAAGTAPCLSLFVLTEKAEAPEESRLFSLEQSIKSADFAALRRFFNGEWEKN